MYFTITGVKTHICVCDSRASVQKLLSSQKVHSELFMNICDTFVNGHDKVTNVWKVFFAK